MNLNFSKQKQKCQLTAYFFFRKMDLAAVLVVLFIVKVSALTSTRPLCVVGSVEIINNNLHTNGISPTGKQTYAYTDTLLKLKEDPLFRKILFLKQT